MMLTCNLYHDVNMQNLFIFSAVYTGSTQVGWRTVKQCIGHTTDIPLQCAPLEKIELHEIYLGIQKENCSLDTCCHDLPRCEQELDHNATYFQKARELCAGLQRCYGLLPPREEAFSCGDANSLPDFVHFVFSCQSGKFFLVYRI